MLKNHQLPVHMQAYGDVHRETFAALMDLYENNYLRLKKLIPDFGVGQGEYVSVVAGCLDLHLKILEQSKFTSLISLSYRFRRQQSIYMEPDLMVRVYHDVAMAEVLSGQLHHGKLSLDNLPETAIVERWHLNRFLYKWLGFCLHIGHQFEQQASTSELKSRINQILANKIPS